MRERISVFLSWEKKYNTSVVASELCLANISKAGVPVFQFWGVAAPNGPERKYFSSQRRLATLTLLIANFIVCNLLKSALLAVHRRLKNVFMIPCMKY